jgi:prepilin-type N-terminal cleavage/methylation domain-containing protein
MKRVLLHLKKGFTLIELLVVVGIIGLLMAILLPAVNKMMQKAEVATAKTDLSRIVSAWEQYYSEYGLWPVAGSNQRLFFPHAFQQPAAEGTEGMEMTVAVMTNIMYPNVSLVGSQFNTHPVRTNFNPRGIVFMKYDTESLASGGMVDPWGGTYRFLFDLNKDGKVERGGTMATTVYAKVIAWSLGPDGVLSSDDVKSWE